MTTWFLSLLVSFTIAMVWHGFSLKLAMALAGEDSPGFFRAAWVSWMGGLLGAAAAFGFSWTVGFALWFFSAWLSAGLTLLVHVVTTAFVYKRGLKVSWPTGLGVTGIHLVLSLAVNALLGWFAASALL